MESFARALQVSKITQLLQPKEGEHLNFLNYWMGLDYGILRQGTRLLLSHCDFLRLSPQVPLSWRVFLKNLGGMPGFGAASGVGVRCSRAWRSGTRSIAGTIPQHKGELTLGEILMEPIFFNPRLGGDLNSANMEEEQWEIFDRTRRPQCQLMRSSNFRRARAETLWARIQPIAETGITHMVHLIKGKGLGAGLDFYTWPEFRARLGAWERSGSMTRAVFESLISNVKTMWTSRIQAASALKIAHPTWSLADVVRADMMTPGTWLRRFCDGKVGRVEDGSPCVLHAFSGKAGRTDGLAQYLAELSIQCKEIDTVIHAKRHDLLCDTIYERVLEQARKVKFAVAVLGVPCSTFSVARIGGDGINTPAPVRGRATQLRCGLCNLTALQQKEVDNANALVSRSVEIARAVLRAGGDVLFENPCDRGSRDDEDSVVRDRYKAKWADHAPLWLHPEMVELRRDTGLRAVTFPQCALGGSFQKWTTLWYSQGFAEKLDTLTTCTCTHGYHSDIARGRGLRGRWHSAEAAAYPARMNKLIADAIHDCIAIQRRGGATFCHRVRAWMSVDKAGRIDVHGTKDCDYRSDDDGELGNGVEQVHVWEQHELAACDEELQAWERSGEGGRPQIRLWCAGGVVDWKLLEEMEENPGTSHCTGSCNPAHWQWKHPKTDVSHEPTLISDINTHAIYFMELSRLFTPMRTFTGGETATHGMEMGHTTWFDLLTPEVLTQQEFVVSRIVGDRTLGEKGGRQYKIRWAGFDASWDTWEPAEVVEETEALDRYEAEGAVVEGEGDEDTNEGDGATVNLIKGGDDVIKMRAKIMAHRVSHGVNKLTAHKWESVLADAEPLGRGRCRKIGPLNGHCTACLCMLKRRVVESCRHAHLECPFTVQILALILRCATHVSATNLETQQETINLSDSDLVAKHKLMLITGFRLKDEARGSASKRAGDTPICVLIAETHAAIGDRRKGSESGWGFTQGYAWETHSIYMDIRRRMTTHIRHSHREADRRQIKCRIDNPGKYLEEEGPLFDWEQTWVTTGWASRTGRNLMPLRASDVNGSRVTMAYTPWAWRVHPALMIAWWRSREGRNDPSAVINMPRSMSMITDDTLIIYPDGSHDSSKPQAVAGFGFTGIREGDGEADMDARVVVSASGPVITDKTAGVFLGAEKHSNNSGELTALIEGMLWALECDTQPDSAILLRPDSELAMGWTIGDLKAKVNKALVAKARCVYKRLLCQRKGRVYWRHVKGHSGHLRNDHADELANEGATQTTWNATVPREAWRAVRGDGELLHNEGGWKGYNATLTTMVWRVNGGWTIYQRIQLMPECEGWTIRPGQPPQDVHNAVALTNNAVVRIERAAKHDPLGVLNLMPYRSLRIARILSAGMQEKAKVNACVTKVGKRRVQNAITLTDAAMLRPQL